MYKLERIGLLITILMGKHKYLLESYKVKKRGKGALFYFQGTIRPQKTSGKQRKYYIWKKERLLE